MCLTVGDFQQFLDVVYRFSFYQVIVPMSLLLTPKISRNLVSKQSTLLRDFRIMVGKCNDGLDEPNKANAK